ARARAPSRRRALFRRAIVLGIGMGVVALLVILLATPIVGVRTIAVTGVSRLNAAAVMRAAAVSKGAPMVRLSTAAVAANVSALPQVDSVRVSRSWPSTLRIAVTERTPAAWLAEPDGAHLLDRSGVDFAVVKTPPAGLPQVRVTAPKPKDERVVAALRAYGELPASLRQQVRSVAAQAPDNVRFAVTHKRTVVWGSTDEGARKAAVIRVLLSRKGSVYDVATPELPTVS
ncbi:MAG: cell division protein FtsQ/DivIB, partial [Sciscionella sp.]